jgi:hypothetical protein
MQPFDQRREPTEEEKPLHHYEFAHHALRCVCLADPLQFFAVMASPHKQRFVDALWEMVRKECDKSGKPSFSSRDIRVETARIGEYPAVLVCMPPPRNMAEAHMICVVLKVPQRESGSGEARPPSVQYYTLEKGIDLGTMGERTVLCAWNDVGHMNFGDGPKATPEAFFDAVEKLIREEEDR